jgi:hypothetical protein
VSDYNLVSTGPGRWLAPDVLAAALAKAFSGTEFAHDLLPGAPIGLWAYVPDSGDHTGEVTLDDSGRTVSFTDTSRERVAGIAVEVARRFPVTGLQLWRWTREPVPVTARTTEAELLAFSATSS